MAKRDSANVIAVRQKANEIRREKERAERRRRTLIQVGVVVGAILVVAAIVVAVIFASRSSSAVNVPNASATITVDGKNGVPFAVGDHRVRIGADDAAVVLSLYEDYSCPHCKDYEAAVGDTLTELIATGDVAVEYHPIRFVTNYGNRAGSAATCVAEGAPEKWLDVHSGLFALHDASTDGWSNDQFRELLSSQGVTNEDVLECVSDGRYVTWIDQSTTAATDAGISSSPTLLINGEPSELLGAEALRAAVDELLGASE